jgi:hypothetical protein
MTPTWTEFVEPLANSPALAVTLAAGVAAAAWAFHVWRLRSRERRLTLLVDERTRLWQEAVTAHSKLLARVNAAEAAGTIPGLDSGQVKRVLVVGDLREQRAAMKAVFTGLGMAPVFADSPWAATVATQQADAEGAPYDLILVDESLEGIEAVDAGAAGS